MVAHLGQQRCEAFAVAFFEGTVHFQNCVVRLRALGAHGLGPCGWQGCQRQAPCERNQCQNVGKLHGGIMDNSDEKKAFEKKALRKLLIEQRLNLPDRLQRSDLLQRVMRIWLVGRPDIVIGAYWPIKGEFDPLPALHRWKEDGELLDQPQPRRCLLYTSPSPRDRTRSRMPSSA